jgi:hypothetical protein
VTGRTPGVDDPMAELAAADLDAARCHLRCERLRLFRRHLQIAIGRVSPVVLAAFSEPHLRTILGQLEPPEAWPRSGLTPPPMWKLRIEAVDPTCETAPPAGRKARRSCSGLLRHNGIAVRPWGHPLGMLGVKVVGRQLELLAINDDVVVATRGALVHFRLPVEVPETVRAGAAGLELDAVVLHPFTAGRGYPVRRMRALEGATIVEAWTGCLPFRMPWPQLGAGR